MSTAIHYPAEQASLPVVMELPLSEELSPPLLESLPFIMVLEDTLRKKYEKPYYDLSIDVQGLQDQEMIKGYLDSRLPVRPIGGHRNFGKTLAEFTLFLYYHVGVESFYVKFHNVISPYQK